MENNETEMICAATGKKFILSQLEIEFYKKNNLPLPSLCPEERQKNRLLISRSRSLFHRKSDKSGKEILSVYPPDSKFKVYSQEEYWQEI